MTHIVYVQPRPAILVAPPPPLPVIFQVPVIIPVIPVVSVVPVISLLPVVPVAPVVKPMNFRNTVEHTMKVF